MPDYDFQSSLCALVGIGPHGGAMAEQIDRERFENQDCRLGLINASGMPVTPLDLGGCDIGVVFIDEECCSNPTALSNLRRSLRVLKTRPLIMAILLPSSTENPVALDLTSLESWADCIWRPSLSDLPTTLAVAVNNWIEIYMNGGCVGFDADDYLLLFKSPRKPTVVCVAVARDTLRQSENPEPIVARLVHQIETTLEPFDIEEITKMLITVEFCIENASIGHLDAISCYCRNLWVEDHRVVQIAYVPELITDGSDQVRLTVFMV